MTDAQIRTIHGRYFAAAIALSSACIDTAVEAKGIDLGARFDLICQLHGSVVADPNPTYVGTSPANARRWSYSDHFIVDLSLMKYCEASACSSKGPQTIASLTDERIVFRNDEGFVWAVRRDNLRSEEVMVDGGKVSVTKGSCRIAPFSGLPSPK